MSVRPSVHPSIHPSVCRQGFRNFLKKLLAQFISYLAFTLMGWVSWLLIVVFLASFLALWGPNIWSKMGFQELFEKNYWSNSFHTWHLPLWKWDFRNFLKKLLAQFISYLAFTLMGWISWPLYIFMFLASFSALWWPNIWPKMGLQELDPYTKTIGSIDYIPGIYLLRYLNPLCAKFFSGTKTCIYISCHSSTLTWHRWLKSFLKQDKKVPILHSQYHGCWCPGNAMTSKLCSAYVWSWPLTSPITLILYFQGQNWQ